MNCDECRDTLVEYSLGELSPAAMLRIDEHLAQPCVECQRELAEINQALHGLGAALEPVNPPAHVKSQLTARMRDDVAAPVLHMTPLLPDAPSRAHWRRVLPYAAAMLVAALLGATAANYWQQGRLTEAELREFEHRLDTGRRLFDPPRLQAATFHAPQPAAGHLDPPAYIIGDQLAGQWHFYAFDLNPPAVGHRLQLWFLTADGRWLKAEPLQLKDDGSCSALFNVPPQTQIARAVITDEPNADAPEPQGRTLLTAELPAIPK